jgi:hypothetical protein
MHLTKHILLVLAAIAVAGCATSSDGGKWTCAALGILNSSYDGSDFAFIHLQGFAAGHSYQVVKNRQGDEATGTTQNGTPFVCERAR